jgi:hypothetical protein
MYEGKTCAEK